MSTAWECINVAHSAEAGAGGAGVESVELDPKTLALVRLAALVCRVLRRCATLTDASTLKLCRLRYIGSAHQWQFAIYRASHDHYDEAIFPTGPLAPAKTPSTPPAAST
jgi:hypothetical protein